MVGKFLFPFMLIADLLSRSGLRPVLRILPVPKIARLTETAK